MAGSVTLLENHKRGDFLFGTDNLRGRSVEMYDDFKEFYWGATMY